MLFQSSRHSRLVKCFLCIVLLSAALSAGQVFAGDKEERMPNSVSFDTIATLLVYADQVTPPNAVSPTTSEIWTVFPDGLGKQRLTSGHNDTNPRFSLDGKSIIFQRDGDGEIWAVNTSGGNVRNLTITPQIYERDAHFSNDGESLFLLSPAPIPFTEKELADEPLLALGVGHVLVQLNLKDGTRRQLLDENYHVKSVFPDPYNDKVALVICDAVDANGKSTFIGGRSIVAVPLDGTPPRNVYQAPTGYNLEAARSGGDYLAFSASAPNEHGSRVFLLKKAQAGRATGVDLKKLDKMSFLGDLSSEGKEVVGTSVSSFIDKGVVGYRWSIVCYDIANDKWRTVIEE